MFWQVHASLCAKCGLLQQRVTARYFSQTKPPDMRSFYPVPGVRSPVQGSINRGRWVPAESAHTCSLLRGSRGRVCTIPRRVITPLASRTFPKGLAEYLCTFGRKLQTSAVCYTADNKGKAETTQTLEERDEYAGPENRSASEHTIQSLTSVRSHDQHSLEKYYKRDDVSSEAILLYRHEGLGRYRALYGLTLSIYMADLLAVLLLLPPPGVSLVDYMLRMIADHGFYHPFTLAVALLPFTMHAWTAALKLARRQLRAIYFLPSIGKYIAIGHTWRWKARRITFSGEEVKVDRRRENRIQIQEHPYILHPECFTSEVYRERLLGEKQE